ncbi:hypothetical protein [Paractinoplanes atraurantiacus]|uniref:Uncharacterized protein n=1 Tax=Paractinoplanes atraurantiacus TaxID=1036182 RepID=A0A285GZ82_9ACTN|nr:hypothetical protein [Actinoplanes atraurantiacus]SNY28822.1 hypothetical protein SAMN05421748_103139 [Actinoplanes atraurantiacus]
MTQSIDERAIGRRRSARPLTVALWVVLGIYLIGTFLTLTVAVVRSGDYGALLAPGLERLGDPKDSIPVIGPESVWNPLFWLVALPHAIVLYFPQLPVVGLTLAGIALVVARGRSVQAAAWAVVWVALTVLAFSPFGETLHNWLLD